MKEGNYKMVATTMLGLEGVLEEELRKLGAQHIYKLNRAVEFVGDLGFMYKSNLNLRTAIRVLKPIFEFQARNEKELYKKTIIAGPLSQIQDLVNLHELTNLLIFWIKAKT